MLRKLTLLFVLLAVAVTPAFAQEEVIHTIAVDGFSFPFDPAFAANVNIAQYPGDPPEFGPGFADAPHVRFDFYTELGLPDTAFNSLAGVRLYRSADLEAYPFLAMQADALQSLVTEGPDLALFEARNAEGSYLDVVPYIPTLLHGQILRARLHYVETEQISGIAYITYSNAAREPFLANYFTYTFQGVSADGQWYISASLPILAPMFPTEPEPIEPEVFYNQWAEYMTESVAALEGAAPGDFTPSLDTLYNLVQTFSFDASAE